MNNITITKNQTKDKDLSLCILLGFFLSLLGVLISAIIAGSSGVRKAFRGIAIRWLFIVVIVVLIRAFNIGKGAFSKAQENVIAASDNQDAEQNKTQRNNVCWVMSESKSKIDDSACYTLICEGNELLGWRKEKPELVIRYMEGKSSFYIVFPMYLGSNEATVTIRFDSDEAITETWNISTDGHAVFAPWSARDVINSLLSSQKLIVRLTPYGESPITCTFHVTGLKDVIAPILPLFEE